MAESREEGRERNRDVVCHSLTRPTSMSASLSLISQASLGQLICFSSIKCEQLQGAKVSYEERTGGRYLEASQG